MGFEQISKDLNNLVDTVVKNKQRYQTVASNQVVFDLSKRVFNNGSATDGSGIGNYNYLPYRRYREKRGRQVGYVDLQLDGNLFRSIQTGASGNDIVAGFIDPDQADIARQHEARYRKRIFTANEKEEENAEKAFETELDITVRNALR